MKLWCRLFGHTFMGTERHLSTPERPLKHPLGMDYMDVSVRLDYCNRCGLTKQELGITPTTNQEVI